jgi:hypothetical protein
MPWACRSPQAKCKKGRKKVKYFCFIFVDLPKTLIYRDLGDRKNFKKSVFCG